MAFHTITLKSNALVQELEASGAITPGHLLYRTGGKVAVHASAGQNAERLFAVEDELQGRGISTAYTTANRCFFKHFQPGDEVYALLTKSQSVVDGDWAESAGDGTVRKHSASSAGAVEYPESVVGVFRETKVTTSAATARVILEIV